MGSEIPLVGADETMDAPDAFDTFANDSSATSSSPSAPPMSRTAPEQERASSWILQEREREGSGAHRLECIHHRLEEASAWLRHRIFGVEWTA